jgi:solute carrier family 35 (UDP-sugar transporter), member A1/2/3
MADTDRRRSRSGVSNTPATRKASLSNSHRRRASDEVISLQKGYLFMLCLAMQYGLQPLLQKACINKHTVNKVSLLVVAELVKIVICLSMILSKKGAFADITSTWTLRTSLQAACLPAALYAVQNWLSQIAYQNLDSLTFNLLNQTKTLSAAVCLYLVMGKRQSGPQLVALMLLLAAAMLLNSRSDSAAKSSVQWESGIAPLLGASLLSGFSAAVTQKTLQVKGRNSFLLSLELAVYGIITLVLSTIASGDSYQVIYCNFIESSSILGYSTYNSSVFVYFMRLSAVN